MSMLFLKRCVYAAVLCLIAPSASRAQQFLTDMIDTTTEVGSGLFTVYQNYNRLRISGYMQPQWQWAEAKGARGYFGGDFQPQSNNRFTLRRGRFRLDYVRRNKRNLPVVHFTFQFDGTERGVNIRDMWGRFLEHKYGVASLTTGMFARPFGFEINLSSVDRESPERGRASQILMRTERDLGAMVTLQPSDSFLSGLRWLRLDAGLFNGQGLGGSAEYDSRKDFIGRLSFRPPLLSGRKLRVSGSVSHLSGGVVNTGPILFQMGTDTDGLARPTRDSGGVGRILPRRYWGADAQVRISNRHGATEVRGEYWRGTQTASALSSETPGTLPNAGSAFAPLYVRPFDAAFFYLLQSLGTADHQLVLKYDWYDPNTRVRGNDVAAARGFSAADVRHNTLGGGYVWYMNPNAKATVWYEHIVNETTAVDGYREDLPDDAVTVRLQFRF